LKRALVLIDSRHGIKDVDREVMTMLDEAAVSYHLVSPRPTRTRPATSPRSGRDGARGGLSARPRIRR
jgi:GTP-binding protein